VAVTHPHLHVRVVGGHVREGPAPLGDLADEGNVHAEVGAHDVEDPGHI
jgi:hypothetical protein